MMNKTLWFSYSTVEGLDALEPLRSPYNRTWHLGRFLREKAASIGYEFRYVNLDDTTPVTLSPDDIVIGHVWFNDGSFMQQALRQPCRAKFAIQPYTHKMVGDEALPLLHEMFGLCDNLFLITGEYWWDTMPEIHWKAKATRLDNSVNTLAHPFMKRKWNVPGKRAALCIGYSNPVKGLDKVAELAQYAGLRLGHFGGADPEIFRHVPQFTDHGGAAFTPDVIQYLCNEYDFFLSMGRYDANPSALQETSAWGLIGLCTKESGYWPNQPFMELRLEDMVFNLEQIERLQTMSEYDLQRRAEYMRQVMSEERYSWRFMCEQVWSKILEHLG